MAEGGRSFMSVTKKRAKRVQEKIRQKLGQGEQTKDEVFEEFVEHFTQQQTAANKLQKELIRYMHASRMLYQSTKGMRDILTELYEPSWEGHDHYKDIFERKLLLWEDLITSLHSKMVEPMNQYTSRFPDVKGRISKRERKVVDYDLTRRELEVVKGKTKVSEQKVQQTEDAFLHAKQLFDEITDELYEELPTFYDSRVQFYASLFQSIASTEAKFHEEITKVDEDFSEVMDKLVIEAATGVHTTKKERGAVVSPKLLSRPGEDSDDNSGSEPSTPVIPHPTTPATSTPHTPTPLTATPPHTSTGPALPSAPQEISPANDNLSNSNSIESPSISPSSTPSHTPKRTPSTDKPSPMKPAPFGSIKRPPPSKPARSPSPVEEGKGIEPTTGAPESESRPSDSEVPAEVGADVGVSPLALSPTSEPMSPASDSLSPTHSIKSPPPKPAREEEGEGGVEDEIEERMKMTMAGGETGGGDGGASVGMEPVAREKEERTNADTTELYKVVATHPYTGEDEDELTFEKGEIVSVIPYEDSEDEEEGWLMGRIDSTGVKGVFPFNFTKRLD